MRGLAELLGFCSYFWKGKRKLASRYQVLWIWDLCEGRKGKKQGIIRYSKCGEGPTIGAMIY